ncbi:hypothetical protein EV138_3178 [Kribbella voronezhensis]|uniref:Uncharacterized protein n=1 Tax=Kribbella voronezhensis TaxID=2512212 RepID=A0A4R7TC12_9ACTN|nr:hypothetical protein [Kribbella voronezhensis]TDU89604.1 hypothetical protein EV138_3178 [Kribbella voronezhensis]
MDLTKAAVLRELLTGTELAGRTTSFAHSLRRFTTRVGGLLLFGPPEDEPWHLTAHLDDELHRAGVEDVRPSLVRWSPPPGAPPHLAIGLDRLRDSGRGESLLVVAEQAPPDALLERIDDVRRRGTTIFSIAGGSKDLADLSHESLVPELLVPATFGSGWVSRPIGQDPDAPDQLADPVDHDEPDHGRHAVPDDTLTALRDAVAGFEMTQHLVSLAVADDDITQSAWRRRLRTFIERLGGEPV